ncbi:MAG: ParB/RepB/Spo0J family partition protein [Alphaproteobacteria bacterium]|nr:MAG: ParB/RepB/Spo0J family partition protein [Alphaproteobacteria bacterium]
MNKIRMGKGLEELLGKPKASDYSDLNIEQIVPSELQTRLMFNQEKLDELAMTIKNTGVLQPIIVVKFGEKFKIVSGERRYRACKIAGLDKIPARIVNWSEKQILEANILENIQRANLNPMEEAKAYQKLMTMHNFTQEEVAAKVGKSRSHIANLMRLLKLPVEVQDYILSDKLSIGHGKILLSKQNLGHDVVSIARKILKEDISIAKVSKETNNNDTDSENVPNASDEYNSIAQNVSEHLGFKISIKKTSKKKGIITIDFSNDIELDEILSILNR